jgi:type IV pilus biogenesis protein PilP
MFGKTNLFGVFLLALFQAAQAQTIDEIAELNREAALAEAKGRIAAAKKADTPATPSAPTPGPLGSAPGMPLPPSMAMPSVMPAWTPIVQKANSKRPPTLMAIYGVGHSLIAELSEGGFEAKYREGDKTPAGWTIARIEKRNVDITRPGRSKGKASKVERISLAFGTKIEVPKETDSGPSDTLQGKYGVPPLPLPSSYSVSR